MALTELELTIDQSTVGWLTRAGKEAAALLAAQGRPQMAVALAAAFRRTPTLTTLQAYLRTRLTPGAAPAIQSAAQASHCGALGGAKAYAGCVPRRPQAHLAVEPPEERGEDLLVLGGDGLVVVGQNAPGLGEHLLRALQIGEGGGPQTLWTAHSLWPWPVAAHDGEHLATLNAYGSGIHGLCLNDLITGARLWSRRVKLPETRQGGAVQLLVTAQAVVVCSGPTGWLSAYDRDSGEPLWGEAFPTDNLPQMLVCGETLCLQARRGLFVYELATGRGVRALVDLVVGVPTFWASGDHAYLVDDESTLRLTLPQGQFSLLTKRLNRPPEEDRTNLTRETAATDTLAVLSSQNWLRAVNLQGQAHEELWRVPVGAGESAYRNLFIVGEAAIRVVGSTLSAYRLEDGAALWQDLRLDADVEAVWGHPQGLMARTTSNRLYWIGEETPEELPCP